MKPNDHNELQIFQRMIMSFDSPAYMRRAREVEAAWNAVQQACMRRRQELLKLPRLRLMQLYSTNGNTLVSVEGLCATQLSELQQLYEDWMQQEQKTISVSSALPSLPDCIDLTAASFERFNQRWSRYISGLSLVELNRLRQGYNDFYVLEKECAVRSSLVARIGFEPMRPATTADLFKLFPLLPIVCREDLPSCQ